MTALQELSQLGRVSAEPVVVGGILSLTGNAIGDEVIDLGVCEAEAGKKGTGFAAELGRGAGRLEAIAVQGQ